MLLIQPQPVTAKLGLVPMLYSVQTHTAGALPAPAILRLDIAAGRKGQHPFQIERILLESTGRVG